MLGWHNLPLGKRAGAVFLLFLILSCGPFFVYFASSPGEKVQAAGAFLISLGVLLDPQWFFKPSGALIDFDRAPKVCLALYGIGAIAFCGGWAVKQVMAA